MPMVIQEVIKFIFPIPYGITLVSPRAFARTFGVKHDDDNLANLVNPASKVNKCFT